MADIFIETKLDLIRTSLKKLEKEVLNLQQELSDVEYKIQQDDFKKLEKELLNH